MIQIPETANAVEFKSVSKSYGKLLGKSNHQPRVLNEFSLSIPQGITFGLLGPNGAGKSTSLKALMGLHEIDGGTIEIFGNDISRIRNRPEYLALRQKIGYVSEVHHVYKWMKIKDAIRFVRSFRNRWNETMETELLDLFELSPNQQVKQLSKGMLAKLSLLLAVTHEPELLILDEPTSGLDPMVREEFLYGILKTISEKEQTVIFSSHSIDDVQRIADRVGLLRNGKLVVDQSVEHILTTTKRLRAALKDDCQPAWTPTSTIWQQVNRREWQLTVEDFTPEILNEVQMKNPVENIEVRDLSLEDIFKDYVRSNRKAKEIQNA